MEDADNPEVARPSDEDVCELGEYSPWEEGTTAYRVTDLVLHSSNDLTVLAERWRLEG